MGNLTVYLRNYKDGPLVELWQRSGDQGQVWNRNLIELNVTQPFQIVIEAEIGPGYTSDIAIDDTVFGIDCLAYNMDLPMMPTTIQPPTTTAKPCGDTGFQCGSGSCIDKSLVLTVKKFF
jgi:hypothetical protein